MLLNKNKQLKYFNLNTNDKTDTTKWNINRNYNFSQKAKIALVSINNATDSNLNMVFCPTIKNNYFSSLNTSPLIYAGVGYNNQNIINEKQYYDVNGAYLSEIELKTYSSAPQNDLSYPEIPALNPIIWYKFDNSGNIGLDSMGKANMAQLSGTVLPYYDDVNFIKGNASARSVAGENKGRATYNFSDVIDEFSISFWICITVLRTSTDMVLTGNTDLKFSITRNGSSTSYSVSLFNSGYITAFSGAWVADNKWRHITITAKKTIDNDVELNFYLNGVLNKTNTSGTWDTSGLTYIQLYGWNLTFQGNMDDIRLYNKVLTQDQVNLIYSNTRINYPIIKNEALKLALISDNDQNIHTFPNSWYRFETGAITTDSGTNNITLTNNGTATSTGYSIRGNNSITFNGTTQYLTGTITNISNNSFSFSFWVLMTSAVQWFFSVGNEAVNNKYLHAGLNASYKYIFNFRGNDSTSINAYPSDFNVWVHLTFIYNYTTKEKSIYRNGVKIEITNSIPTAELTVSNVLTIGKIALTANYFNGKMDDFRIYTGKALDQDEVLRIYTGAKTDYTTQITEPIIGQDLTPNLWCKFDTGAITTNSGSDSITITNYGAGGPGNGVLNSGVALRGNNSAIFDGNATYLTGTIQDLNNNSFSISLWVYNTMASTTTGMFFSVGSVGTTYATFVLGTANNTYFVYDMSLAASSSAFTNDINNWVHIVCMYNANTLERSIYRNGVKLTLSNPIQAQKFNINSTFTIGRYAKTGIPYNYFAGYIDDLRVYTGTILSQAQINEIYAGNTYYTLPTTENKYNTNPTNTQYQIEIVDEEQKIISHY